jgi:hypothetical protein
MNSGTVMTFRSQGTDPLLGLSFYWGNYVKQSRFDCFLNSFQDEGSAGQAVQGRVGGEGGYSAVPVVDERGLGGPSFPLKVVF